MDRLSPWTVALGILLAAIALGLPAASALEVELPFDPANFEDGSGDPFPIDNPYWPLVPGTIFTYEAETEDETVTTVFEVTHDTKLVADVVCTVVSETEYEDDLLVEATEDWYAQDQFGNIWYFGEDTEEYEYDDDGNLIDTSTEGSWEAGVDGAEPGIIMLADPQPGLSYRQEYYEDEAEDMGKVLRLNATVSIELGLFTDCLVTKEWTPLERGSVEHKFYAPGVGLVLVKELKEKTTVVELVEIDAP